VSRQYPGRPTLDLKDPLSKFFKRFPRWAESITVENLLHHTSRLPDYTRIYEASRPTRRDMYAKAQTKPDHWYPGMPVRNPKGKELSNKEVLEWLHSAELY
jgi:CubicO group peptidase (beta-lactamase class C family)